MRTVDSSSVDWPALPVAEWQDTYDTLHMYTQVVGKIRLELSPMMNHWWQVPLYVTARGLTTSPIPNGADRFQIDFDFFDHALHVDTQDGRRARIDLGGSVRDFYTEVMHALATLGIEVRIWTMPVEFPDPIRFDEDDTHATYDRDQVHRCFCALRSVDTIFKEFRARFTGKSSPVHFFWGAFDLAVTRFSGKPATPPPNADPVTRIGYNAELASLGFWPGGRWIDGSFTNDAVFFAYAFPEPEGYRTQPVSPTPAAYDTQMSEFVLPYEAVRIAPDPRAALLEFAQVTYEAGARLMNWPIADLELHDTRPGRA